jgi:hypothetical protein
MKTDKTMTTEQKWQAEALHYAQNMSKAPDKETPDWIMHDYLQGIEAYKSALRKAIEEMKKGRYFGEFDEGFNAAIDNVLEVIDTVTPE